MQIIEIGLSFLEGLGLILSPCILPVLPLVLSASLEGGRKRPFGIIFGFIVAFAAFALLSRRLVMVLHINLDYIKYGSLVFLTLFGLVLLSEKLSNIFSKITQPVANAGSSFVNNTWGGFGSGIWIGLCIGLVWTPCAGPILAAVLVQIIRQESNFNALFLVLSFAFGASVPMLIIALSGRKLMSKLNLFIKHAAVVRKTFGIIILFGVAFIASGVDVQTLFTPKESFTGKPSTTLQDALPSPYRAPEFVGIETWLNSQPLTMASLRGKVVLIDFWTYSCINCIRTLPYITKWYQEYRKQGLVIIGIHAPEFEFEKDKSNVAAAIVAHQIKYPVALDNKLDTWKNFHNRYWPAHYLIDQRGQVVYIHFGEGNYAETENNIRTLLSLNAKKDAKVEEVSSNRYQTPETYLGYARSEHFSSPEGIQENRVTNYTLPKLLLADHWALAGKWRIEDEQIVSATKNATLRLNFTAGKVFLVLGNDNNIPIKVTLKLNGSNLRQAAGKDVSNGVILVKNHRLYGLIQQDRVKNGVLEIIADAPGLAAYAFTFGN